MTHNKNQKNGGAWDTFEKVLSFVGKHDVIFSILVLLLITFYSGLYAADMNKLEDYGYMHAFNDVQLEFEKEVADLLPHLSETEQQNAALEKGQKYLRENKDSFNQDVQDKVLEYKEEYQDEFGLTYVFGNDPFYYLRQARNLQDYGMIGDVMKGTKEFDSKRNVPIGLPIEDSLLPHLITWAHSVVSLVLPSFTLEASGYYLPLLFFALTVIMIFFISRRLTNTVCGLIAGAVFSVHPTVTQVAHAGFPDTNTLNMLLSSIVAFVFVVLIDQERIIQKAFKNRLSNPKSLFLSSICVFSMFLLFFIFKFTWSGYFYMFVIVLASMVGYLLIRFIGSAKQSKIFILLGASLVIIVGVIIFLIKDANFISVTKARLGLDASLSFFPKGLSTVQELLPTNLGLLGSLHGGKFIFYAAVLSLVYLAYLGVRHKSQKRYLGPAIFILCWYIGLLYAASHAIRFGPYLMLPLSIILGVGAFFLFKTTEDYINRTFGDSVEKGVVYVAFVFLIVLLLTGLMYAEIKDQYQRKPGERDALYDVMGSIMPNMDDSMHATLIDLKEKSSPDAIIACWWDYGYLMQYVAERGTTLDGGTFNMPRTYWTAKALLSNNGNETSNIIHMLSCGTENQVFNTLKSRFGDSEGVRILKDSLAYDRVGLWHNLWDEKATMYHMKTTLDSDVLQSMDPILRTAALDTMRQYKVRYVDKYYVGEKRDDFSFAKYHLDKTGDDISDNLNYPYLNSTSEDELSVLFSFAKDFIDDDAFFEEEINLTLKGIKIVSKRHVIDMSATAGLSSEIAKAYAEKIRKNKISLILSASRLHLFYHFSDEKIDGLLLETEPIIKDVAEDRMLDWILCDAPETYFVLTEDLLFKYPALSYFSGWDFDRPEVASPKPSPFRSTACYEVVSGIRCYDGTYVDLENLDSLVGGEKPRRLIVSEDGTFKEKIFDEPGNEMAHILYKKKTTYRSFLIRESDLDNVLVRLLLLGGDGLNDFELFSFHDDGDVSKRTVAYRMNWE